MMYFVLSGCWSVTISSRSYFSWSGYSLPSPATNFSLPGSCRGDLILGFLGFGDGVFCPWFILESSFILADETDFRGDMDSFFFAFFDTTSFHSPSRERSVMVSAGEWVLGPCGDAKESWGVDGVKFTTKILRVFRYKNSDIYHISAQNIHCEYSLEPPRRGGSNEYPQSMFLSRNKKNNEYTCKPKFYCIKVG